MLSENSLSDRAVETTTFVTLFAFSTLSYLFCLLVYLVSVPAEIANYSSKDAYLRDTDIAVLSGDDTDGIKDARTREWYALDHKAAWFRKLASYFFLIATLLCLFLLVVSGGLLFASVLVA